MTASDDEELEKTFHQLVAELQHVKDLSALAESHKENAAQQSKLLEEFYGQSQGLFSGAVEQVKSAEASLTSGRETLEGAIQSARDAAQAIGSAQQQTAERLDAIEAKVATAKSLALASVVVAALTLVAVVVSLVLR